ncbi:MAG: ribosome recycling factor [Chlamydiae bacterium]|nr:ribosome recycling factor [Chlamydiota bacterium]
MNSISEEIKTKMNSAIQHFKDELKKLRTGRANPGILDNVMVEAYGTHMRLKELASVSAPEARQLLVTPFDPHNVGPIAKGIESANLNLQPIKEGNMVRINIPPMDETTRKEMAKQGKKKAEEAKVTIREIRRKGNDQVKSQKSGGKITEDEVKKLEKQIQELTDKFCKEIDDLFAIKEKEIMTI